MSKKKIGLTVFFLILLGVLILRQVWGRKPLEESKFLFGTVIQITAHGPGAREALQEAWAEMEEVQALTSQTHGEVARINQGSGMGEVAVSGELFSFLTDRKSVV